LQQYGPNKIVAGKKHKKDPYAEHFHSFFVVKRQVLRDSTWGRVSEEDLTVGDVVKCCVGEPVPADVVVASLDGLVVLKELHMFLQDAGS
jgi:magnesium-transporting ATPase (P-type)